MSWSFPGSPLPAFAVDDQATLEMCKSLFQSLDLVVTDELLATVRLNQ